MTAILTRRGSISALISAALHTLVLGVLAATSLQMAREDRAPIPLVIRDAAPPPPPPGSGAAVGPPVVSAPARAPKPIEQPAPVLQPKPIEKPKIAAKPKPPARPRRTRAAAAPPRPAAPEAPAAATAGGGTAGGLVGGVKGGTVGGKVGGRLGGSGDDVFRADQVAVPPSVLESVRPQYPPIARARGQEGIVVVQAIIDRAGAVERDSLRVLQSQNPFDDAAVAAFRRWRFKPGRNDGGQAVRVIVQQPIRFQLR